MISQRLHSLDVLRGATIMAMILVNMPGSWQHVPLILQHSEWHGLMPADFIFPFFLFFMGVSMAYALKRKEQMEREQILGSILQRSLLLILIGWAVHAIPFANIAEAWSNQESLRWTWDESRIPGVLQRLGFCYALAGVLIVYCSRIGLGFCSILVLLGYSIFMVSAGGTDPYSLKENAIGTLDVLLWGKSHLYMPDVGFDPEGIVSSLPATVSVILGYLCGTTLQSKSPLNERLKIIGFWGILLCLIGLVWSISQPFNKNLWTPSYTLFTAGTALCFVSLFSWILDHKSTPARWTYPFRIFGANALAAYCIAEAWSTLMYRFFIFETDSGWKTLYQLVYEYICVPIAGPTLGSPLFGVLHLIVFGLILDYMFRRKIWLKV